MGAVTNSVSRVTKKEGKKVEVGVGQTREIYKLINEDTGGKFYQLLKLLEKMTPEQKKEVRLMLNY